MFTPAIPLGGIGGWRFLEATEATQRATFDKSPLLEREITYFKEHIAGISSAEELVADSTLLKVALGSFGLEDELFKRAFVERILAEGTDDPRSLANRFVDSRYAELSRTFGFGDILGARTGDLGFATKITDAYRTRQFEVAVGEVNTDMRLALQFRREMTELAASDQSDTTIWLRVLGSPPLRTVFEGAFNLPSAFSGLDIDRQVETLKNRSVQLFGDSSPRAMAEPDMREAIINRFLATSQISAGPAPGTPGMAALSLLQSTSGGASGLANLILSIASR